MPQMPQVNTIYCELYDSKTKEKIADFVADDFQLKSESVDAISACPQLSFSGTANEMNLYSKEKQNMKGDTRMNFSSGCGIVKVSFPSSDKQYAYVMDLDILQNLDVGDKIFILNEIGYTYNWAEVSVKGKFYHPSDGEWDSARHMISAYARRTSGGTVFFRHSKKGVDYTSEQWDIMLRDFLNYIYDLLDTKPKEKKGSIWDTSAPEAAEDTSINSDGTPDHLKTYNNQNEKGDNNMKNIFGNIEFGKLEENQNYKLSYKGLALATFPDTEKGGGSRFVIYNVDTDDVEDVTELCFDSSVLQDVMYKMPVALSALKKGDIVFHTGRPVFVKEVKGNQVTVFDPIDRTVNTIIPAKNIFNFNYMTKVVNFLGDMNLMGEVSEAQPFGNMLPFLLLSDNTDQSSLLPLMLMGNKGMENMNPLMLMMFMDKRGTSDDMLLPLLMMQNGGDLFNFSAQTGTKHIPTATEEN